MKHQRPTQSAAGRIEEGDAEISLFTKIQGGTAKQQPAEAKQPEREETPQPALLKPGRRDETEKPDRLATKPVAGVAQAKPRHRRLALGFLLMVVLPAALAAYYLYFVADDQYASRTGF
ncbi:MAG TPA: hypothetical protein VMM55_13265, partial [Thermohalobaculum sp.]|nr:hypothetical protein [Thermohalobaculum sp.]